MNYKIALIRGDGIGPEVVGEAVKVMEAIGEKFGHTFTYTDVLMGGCAIDAVGKSYPDGTAEACKACDAVLLGAVGGPKWGHASDPEKRPETALLSIRRDLHRHPRHPGHRAPGHEGGADPDLHPGWLRRLHPHLRPLPGRTHGRDGGGGAHCLHHQPQLRGPYGPCDQRGHFGLSCCGRRLRCGRLRGRSPRLKRIALQTQ